MQPVVKDEKALRLAALAALRSRKATTVVPAAVSPQQHAGGGGGGNVVLPSRVNRKGAPPAQGAAVAFYQPPPQSTTTVPKAANSTTGLSAKASANRKVVISSNLSQGGGTEQVGLLSKVTNVGVPPPAYATRKRKLQSPLQQPFAKASSELLGLEPGQIDEGTTTIAAAAMKRPRPDNNTAVSVEGAKAQQTSTIPPKRVRKAAPVVVSSPVPIALASPSPQPVMATAVPTAVAAVRSPSETATVSAFVSSKADFKGPLSFDELMAQKRQKQKQDVLVVPKETPAALAAAPKLTTPPTSPAPKIKAQAQPKTTAAVIAGPVILPKVIPETRNKTKMLPSGPPPPQVKGIEQQQTAPADSAATSAANLLLPGGGSGTAGPTLAYVSSGTTSGSLSEVASTRPAVPPSSSEIVVATPSVKLRALPGWSFIKNWRPSDRMSLSEYSISSDFVSQAESLKEDASEFVQTLTSCVKELEGSRQKFIQQKGLGAAELYPACRDLAPMDKQQLGKYLGRILGAFWRQKTTTDERPWDYEGLLSFINGDFKSAVSDMLLKFPPGCLRAMETVLE